MKWFLCVSFLHPCDRTKHDEILKIVQVDFFFTPHPPTHERLSNVTSFCSDASKTKLLLFFLNPTNQYALLWVYEL